jgi:hypothetical protein
MSRDAEFDRIADETILELMKQTRDRVKDANEIGNDYASLRRSVRQLLVLSLVAFAGVCVLFGVVLARL